MEPLRNEPCHHGHVAPTVWRSHAETSAFSQYSCGLAEKQIRVWQVLHDAVRQHQIDSGRLDRPYPVWRQQPKFIDRRIIDAEAINVDADHPTNPAAK